MTLSLAAAPIITTWPIDLPFTLDTLQADDPAGATRRGIYYWFIPSVTGRYMIHLHNGTIFSASHSWRRALVSSPTTFAQTASVSPITSILWDGTFVSNAVLTAGEKYLLSISISAAAPTPPTPILHIGHLVEQAWATSTTERSTSSKPLNVASGDISQARSANTGAAVGASWIDVMEGDATSTDANVTTGTMAAGVDFFDDTAAGAANDQYAASQIYFLHASTVNFQINSGGATAADPTAGQFFLEFETPSKIADRAVMRMTSASAYIDHRWSTSTPISWRRLTESDYSAAPTRPWPQPFRGGSELSGLIQKGTYVPVDEHSEIARDISVDIGPPDANGRFYVVIDDDAQITHEQPPSGFTGTAVEDVNRFLRTNAASLQGFGYGPRYRYWTEDVGGGLKLKLDDGTWISVMDEPRFKMKADSWQGEWWHSGAAADGVPLRMKLDDGTWIVAAYMVPPPSLPADDTIPADDFYPAG